MPLVIKTVVKITITLGILPSGAADGKTLEFCNSGFCTLVLSELM
jgi:hypothetical protein